jgi:hypothetical protein
VTDPGRFADDVHQLSVALVVGHRQHRPHPFVSRTGQREGAPQESVATAPFGSIPGAKDQEELESASPIWSVRFPPPIPPQSLLGVCARQSSRSARPISGPSTRVRSPHGFPFLR